MVLAPKDTEGLNLRAQGFKVVQNVFLKIKKRIL